MVKLNPDNASSLGSKTVSQLFYYGHVAHDPERGLRVTGPLYHPLGRPRPPGRELAAHSRTRTPKSRSWKTLAAVRRRSVERALAPHNHGSLADRALGCSWQVRRALLKRRSMCRRARCHSVSPQSHHRANRKRRHSAEEKESIACRSSHTHAACSSSCRSYPGSVLPCCSQSEHPHTREVDGHKLARKPCGFCT